MTRRASTGLASQENYEMTKPMTKRQLALTCLMATTLMTGADVGTAQAGPSYLAVAFYGQGAMSFAWKRGPDAEEVRQQALDECEARTRRDRSKRYVGRCSFVYVFPEHPTKCVGIKVPSIPGSPQVVVVENSIRKALDRMQYICEKKLGWAPCHETTFVGRKQNYVICSNGTYK